MPENDGIPITTSNQNSDAKNGTGDSNAKGDSSKVTEQEQKDWNDYVDWLEKNNIKSHPDLDKGEGEDHNGLKVLNQYIKLHPNTTLSSDMVPHIQKAFSDLRNNYLKAVKQGKAAFTEGTNEKNFLTDLSSVNGLPGSKTTKYKFPDKYSPKDFNQTYDATSLPVKVK